ncbi:MAG: Cysteinyl tRNA-synthetase [Candidatus Falkowbacteria bacterium GW2011_GWC2_38_22]|uniref:Cysteine--tRNA ligase n=1 Tax=Candidatus Falkowbacteria bacterium GW2011_GWE1_38_31 TaxID=1618638 RepID=A0A0G0K2E0_9BACT|nr:MAG: Cysteinyl tRNA-synthetase [Candidatus Falkowbacteria bacterium GW2011_GWF2_38_1205]KKQ60547.1 MAG: Cysteinyl tRNA-synthetase [Candidatus Falkowbacteria bacterium GW2011_GWC2_38_22]KKQ62666.1 MAG: Cysteinyl tRNA-synthetase [Candidatus Falkowbacteria bacterium GW2011_GWF1_38_22]KKQ64726.1 MAG: Cysteinyl tRNA-synthetase [Candidatus Falkowbacteria bacterium GW2011_GWE2_38_254]KKQ69605.1 MAG: Cysteinyl tRNA-synthetase [Candidatus Falkowbacteria bacterium GW2011_GWE1_38_31]KKQ72042.1 MAG: Cy
MRKLYLYNTLSKSKEEFNPIKDDQVGLYTCGPTVYNYAHIGNLRSYIFADFLARVLRYNFGQNRLLWVMNITDVDDKTIRDSKIKYPDMDSMPALKKLTSEYEGIFWQDMEKMNILKPNKVTHAADDYYILKMQDLVKKIVEKGYGYVKEGSVYFNVKKYSNNHSYGKLINLDVSNLKLGVSVEADEYEKENVQDFVLWKGRKSDEPFWEFLLNNESLPGRPGWHIECSAMGEAELGMPFDIHTGGIDLKFPHHENEIAQSIIGYNVAEPVNFWIHNDHLLVDGQRMGKRFKNFYTTKDLEEKGFKPLVYRFYCMQTNYGKQMNFTWEGLKASQEGLNHLYNQVKELIEVSDNQRENLGVSDGSFDLINKDFKNEFIESINDDLNMSKALAVLQKTIKSNLSKKEKLNTILDFDKVLGLDIEKEIYNQPISDEINDLIKQREKFRREKNWSESDRLREEIEKLGYGVEDGKDGMRIIKK